MKRLSSCLLAAVLLLAPVTLLAASATTVQERVSASAAEFVPIQSSGASLPAPEGFLADTLLAENELAELATLEAEHVDLQQQTAGFFGPRIGTIIVIALILILVL